MREVDDALREDQALAAIRRHGKTVVAGLAAVLIALGAWLWWGNHQSGVAATRSENFTLALDQLDAGNLQQASSQLQPIATAGAAGSQAAARLLQADIAAKRGAAGEADALYAAVRDDTSAPAPYRDLANIRDVALRFDTLPADQVISRLRPLAAPGNPWFGSAGELVGLAYLKQGHKDLAATLFGQITKDKTVPDSLKARAQQIASTLGYDSVDDIPAAASAVSS